LYFDSLDSIQSVQILLQFLLSFDRPILVYPIIKSRYVVFCQINIFIFIGLLFTYISPLVFVLMITLVKEVFDDFQRLLKDKELNNK
jgi:hypothetical protein